MRPSLLRPGLSTPVYVGRPGTWANGATRPLQRSAQPVGTAMGRVVGSQPASAARGGVGSTPESGPDRRTMSQAQQADASGIAGMAGEAGTSASSGVSSVPTPPESLVPGVVDLLGVL